MSDSASTTAHALADILRKVRASSPSKGLSVAWSEVLQAEYGTVEFDLRHSQCYALFTATISSLDSLDERKRSRYYGYAHQWWKALTVPNGSWGTGVASDDIITKQSLDILDGLGDVQESTFAGTSSSPAVGDLRSLSEACADLIDAVNEATLPTVLKRRIANQLHHVRWLIDNAHIFGRSAPVMAAEDVMGRVASATATHVHPDEQPVWRLKLAKLGTAIMLACGVVTTGGLAIESAINSVSGVLESGTQFVESVRGDEDSDAASNDHATSSDNADSQATKSEGP